MLVDPPPLLPPMLCPFSDQDGTIKLEAKSFVVPRGRFGQSGCQHDLDANALLPLIDEPHTELLNARFPYIVLHLQKLYNVTKLAGSVYERQGVRDDLLFVVHCYKEMNPVFILRGEQIVDFIYEPALIGLRAVLLDELESADDKGVDEFRRIDVVGVETKDTVVANGIDARVVAVGSGLGLVAVGLGGLLLKLLVQGSGFIVPSLLSN